MANPFDAAPVAIRRDLYAALGRVWPRLAGAGCWLDGAQRLAVAAEARRAWDCALCRRRKEALSPTSVGGCHEHTGHLPEPWVEVIHRLVTDPGRLSERWCRAALAAGIEEDEFVEMVSVAILTVTVDAFAAGIAMAPPALPTARPGLPDRRRARPNRPHTAWGC